MSLLQKFKEAYLAETFIEFRVNRLKFFENRTIPPMDFSREIGQWKEVNTTNAGGAVTFLPRGKKDITLEAPK